MTTRRQFLGGLGAVFCSCELLDCRKVHAQTARRQVVVNGRRVKTVDIHAHVAFEETNAMMGEKPNPPTRTAMADRIKAMDEQGIDVEALSINAFWYRSDRDLAEKLIKLQNEKLTELCASQPDRFVAFASVALQHPDMAAQQLEYAVKKLGLRGAAIGGSVEAMNCPTRNFIRSGRRRRNSTVWCSSIHSATRVSRNGCAAMAA